MFALIAGASTGEDPQILNHLGFIYLENAVYQKAESLMERARAIFEASLGQDHPNVAVQLSNLGLLYQDTNRLADAEPPMLRALAIGEDSLGEEDPDLATYLNNLGRLYWAMVGWRKQRH